MLKFLKRIAYFIRRWSEDLYSKKYMLLILNFLKQKKLIFNFFVKRNWQKLTDSRKIAKILADNRKSHHPIDTLFPGKEGEGAHSPKAQTTAAYPGFLSM